MKKSFPHRTRCLVITFLSLGMAACAEDAPKPAKVATNNEIKARSVFEYDGDVYLKRTGKPQELLVAKGKWPRWSPDGRRVAVLLPKHVASIEVATGQLRRHIAVKGAHALAWGPKGEQLFYAHSNKVYRLSLSTGKTQQVLAGHDVRELDVGPKAQRIVATVKGHGYSIQLFDLARGHQRRISSGCSASFSPDGRLISQLVDGHLGMNLFRAADGELAHSIKSKVGKYDNQYWTNHPDWLAGETEQGARNIILIHAKTGRVIRLTEKGGAGRGDVFIEP